MVGTSAPDPPGIYLSDGATPTVGSSAGSPLALADWPLARRKCHSDCHAKPLVSDERRSRENQTTGPQSRHAGSYPYNRRAWSSWDEEPAYRSRSGPPGHSTAGALLVRFGRSAGP